MIEKKLKCSFCEFRTRAVVGEKQGQELHMTQGPSQLEYLSVHSQGAEAEEKIIPRATSTGST